MNNKIALYVRVSSEEQARIQDGSLVSQRMRLQEYVEGQNRREEGWGQVFDVYVDEGKSAKDMNRPEFQRLLRDVQSGHVNLVLATELSRLSRSIKDFCALWDFFKSHDTRFITLRDHFDTTTAAGEMMVFNLMNFAQYERKQTSERLIANFTSRANRGLWNGGQLPLGYKRNPANPGMLLVDEQESDAVKTIFATFLKDKNLRTTCLKLSETGIKTKQFTNKKDELKGGNHFTVQSLHNILTNATYVGLREINKRRGDTKRVKASWDGIINEKDFLDANKILQANRRRYKPDEWKTYPYPLTGITVCGECGSRMNGKSAHGKTSKHHYYDHPRTLTSGGTGHTHKCQVQRVRAPRIEELVAQSLKKVLLDPGIFAAGIKAYQESKNTDLPMIKNRIKSIIISIKDNEKRVENLVNRISELPSEVSAAPLYKKLEELQAKIKEEKNLYATLEIEKLKTSTKDLKEDELRLRVQRAIKRLDEAPKEKQREVFSNLLQFIEIHPTKIKLGVYAVSENSGGDESSQNKATGGSAAASGLLGSSNVTSILEGARSKNTVGSRTFKFGGEGEIRTLEWVLAITRFRVVRLQPLGHLSA